MSEITLAVIALIATAANSFILLYWLWFKSSQKSKTVKFLDELLNETLISNREVITAYERNINEFKKSMEFYNSLRNERKN